MRDFFNICVFGDSIAWGYGDDKKGGWVERLRSYFMKPGRNCAFVYNLGVESHTTDDLLVRFDRELKVRLYSENGRDWKYVPFIIFDIGKNDSLFVGNRDTTWVTLGKFEDNLNELVKRAKKYTDKIAFVGLGRVDEAQTIPLDETDESYCNENFMEYNALIGKVCEKNDLKFISIHEILDVEKDLFDGVHPNALGHEKIFRKVLPVVEGMIEEVEK